MDLCFLMQALWVFLKLHEITVNSLALKWYCTLRLWLTTKPLLISNHLYISIRPFRLPTRSRLVFGAWILSNWRSAMLKQEIMSCWDRLCQGALTIKTKWKWRTLAFDQFLIQSWHKAGASVHKVFDNEQSFRLCDNGFFKTLPWLVTIGVHGQVAASGDQLG